MKRVVTAVVCAAVLAYASLAIGQPNDGYLGLYADSLGTQPCVTVPTLTATTLYLLANLSGATAGGITGAEFRIEVSNPTGWSFSYHAPSTAKITMGNPLDLLPDSTDASGLSIAFASCQTSGSGKVYLGKVVVLNFSGVSTSLVVKGHSAPTNEYYPCALFTVCDAGNSKSCMSQSGESPCVLKPSAPPMPVTTSSDSDIFVATLSRDGFGSDPPPETFAEVISRGDTDLWVLGQRLDESFVTCRFDGNQLDLNGVVILDKADRIVGSETLSNEQAIRLYGQVPYVVALMADGMTAGDAGTQYMAALDSLYGTIFMHHEVGGIENARDAASLSPLTEYATASGATLKIKLHGHRTPESILLDRSLKGPTFEQSAKRVTERLAASMNTDSLILLRYGGGMVIFVGAKRQAALTQIQHLVDGKDLQSLPGGPLRRSSPFLRDVLVARGQGQ